jgi:signal peptidase I, bacterial type
MEPRASYQMQRKRAADVEFDFEKRYRLIREIIETLVLTVLMFLIIRLAVQNFNIDGWSMEPNLHNQELVLVDKWSYTFHPPARGDVIVFVAPPDPAQDYIKRIIGLPGDVISVEGTQVYVNGTLLNEVYIDPHKQGNPYPSFKNVIIPPNSYFVMGDNRNGSSDSRDWGCVPRQNVIGRAALVYWPLSQNNDGLLPGVSQVYAKVGAPHTQGLNPRNVCPIQTPQQATTTHTNVSATVSNTLNAPLQKSTVIVLLLPGLCVGYTRRKRRNDVG